MCVEQVFCVCCQAHQGCRGEANYTFRDGNGLPSYYHLQIRSFHS